VRVIDPGHLYMLASYDGGDEIPVQFMKRIGPGYPGNNRGLLPGPCAGTNCQETLRALIDRVKHLQLQESCPENVAIIQLLRMSILLFEQRAAGRRGINLQPVQMHQIESIPTCKICGHIQCSEHTP